MQTVRERWITLGSAVALFAVNAFICRELCSVEFTQHMESIAGSYMTISRYAMDHWGELTWWPLWFTGMPFTHVYQPGFHLTVAAMGTLFRQSPQHIYHLMCALAYCLGPVTLYWLCLRATGRRGYAFVVGLLYSLISPMCFLIPAVRGDVGSYFWARRYQILVHYGEGPHAAAVTMMPLVVLWVHRAATERRWQFIPVAAVGLAAVVLTNWPGAVGLSLALIAYVIARIGADEKLHWPTLVSLGAIAYLLACRWIPPSVIASVQRNAQESDATTLGVWRFAVLLGLLVFLVALQSKLRADPWLRFFLNFSVLTGAIVLANGWARIRLLPQPNRLEEEMELAVIGLGVYLAALVWDRSAKPLRVALVAGLVLFSARQISVYRNYAREQTQSIEIEKTTEYQTAKWFEANMHGARVFAPGSISLWMNLFTEVPQVVGCCDQGVPSVMHRIAMYTIYSDENAGPRAAEVSLAWLKAYGASAIGMVGAQSREVFKPYQHPAKFDGVLRELWRNGDDVIYEVPRRSASLAHVIRPDDVVSRAPVHGLDTEPLARYVAALDDPAQPIAAMRWLSPHRARIEAELRAGQLVSVQVSYDHGWRALVNGVRRRIRADKLGLMVIAPQCTGACAIDLIYDGGAEATWAAAMQAIGFLLLIGWTVSASFSVNTKG